MKTLLAILGAAILLTQLDWPVQAQEEFTPAVGVVGYLPEQSPAPQPYSMPTGIDIVQVVRAPSDGTFLFSCSNGRILWVKREGPWGWTSNWTNRNRLDYAVDGGVWKLVVADDEVWAEDGRNFILVWD